MHSRFLQMLLASLCLVAIGFASQTPTEQSAPGIGIGVGEKMPTLYCGRSIRPPSFERRVDAGRMERCCFSSVPPIGDPSAKRSSCSCKMLKKHFEDKGHRVGGRQLRYVRPSCGTLRSGTKSISRCLPIRTPRSSRSFGVLNTEATGMTRGMAHAGILLCGRQWRGSREVFRGEVYGPLHGKQCDRQNFPRAGGRGQRKSWRRRT